MHLPLTRYELPIVYWLDSATSTNAVLREKVSNEEHGLPHGTLVATANQTAGRGRQGRDWETPPNTAVAASLLLRPEALADGLGMSWLPLLVGSAVAGALRPLFAASRGAADGGFAGDRKYAEDKGQHGTGSGEAKRVGVKWPNDVHVRDEGDAIAGQPGAKLSGILCEVLPDGSVVAGFGINLLQEDWQLPTERAGSVLACEGDVGGALELNDDAGQALVDGVLSRATVELMSLVELAANEPERARKRVLRDSLTIGSEVRVHLPGGQVVDGRAVGLDENGALIVDRPTTGQLIVNAADIEHLR